jgi:hypothetical protein
MFPLFNKKKPIGQHVPGTVGMDGKMVPYDNDKPYRVIPDREEYKSGIVPPQQPVAMDEPRTEPHTVSPMMAVSDEVGNYTAPPPSRGTQGRINEIIGKDYSIEKDDQGNITHRGKDRDKKWSIGDKILSGLSGMFNGDGLIPAATDRNYMEKQADKREMSRLVPQVQQQRQAEGFETDQKYKQTQIDLAPVKVEQNQQKIDNTAEDKQRTYDLRVRTQGWKEKDKLEYHQLEREKLEALKQNRTDVYELAVRRQVEIERSNKAKEEDRDLDREVKVEKEQGVNRRQQITIQAQKEAAAVRAAEQKGMAAEAQAARERLLKLQQEYKGLQ